MEIIRQIENERFGTIVIERVDVAAREEVGEHEVLQARRGVYHSVKITNKKAVTGEGWRTLASAALIKILKGLDKVRISLFVLLLAHMCLATALVDHARNPRIRDAVDGERLGI